MVFFFCHVALSRETLSRNNLPAALPLLLLLSRVFAVTGFPLCISQVLQSRPTPGLCTTCLLAVITLSLIVVFRFLMRFVPCVLAMFALVHALRLPHRSALAQDCYTVVFS